jgi:hypothetical protein
MFSVPKHQKDIGFPKAGDRMRLAIFHPQKFYEVQKEINHRLPLPIPKTSYGIGETSCGVVVRNMLRSDCTGLIHSAIY